MFLDKRALLWDKSILNLTAKTVHTRIKSSFAPRRTRKNIVWMTWMLTTNFARRCVFDGVFVGSGIDWSRDWNGQYSRWQKRVDLSHLLRKIILNEAEVWYFPVSCLNNPGKYSIVFFLWPHFSDEHQPKICRVKMDLSRQHMTKKNCAICLIHKIEVEYASLRLVLAEMV
jgi:hypothetical protein